VNGAQSRRRPLCADPDLQVRIVEAQDGFLLANPPQCEDGASRRISVVVQASRGGWVTLQADVCLWHSLVAINRSDVYARLVRVLDDVLTTT